MTAVTAVTANTGASAGGERQQSTSAVDADDGQRLHARSLWEDRGRPAKPRLRDGVRIIDVETFIANANEGDLAAFIDGLEGAA